MFEKIEYYVAGIDGDYAYLRKCTDPDPEDKCVARALLPPEIQEGSRIDYEMMQYTLVG
ncbi:MAG: chorismate--pyruvate lyase [Lachnospiraceae bacterium]